MNAKNCCKILNISLYIYIKFVIEIFKLTLNCVRDRILVCVVKFVNPFARRQHLFVIAAKPIDVDPDILSYPVSLYMFQFRQNVII